MADRDTLHTPGKWYVDDQKGELYYMDFDKSTSGERKIIYRLHDLDRAAACINACAGIKSEDIPTLLADRDRLAAENTELRGILGELNDDFNVWWVITGGNCEPDRCAFCRREVGDPHINDDNYHCLVLRVEAFLAAHQPTTNKTEDS
jgi:hypothetical protein